MRSRREAAWSCVIRIRDTETRVEQDGRCLPDLSTHKERAQAWKRPRVEDMRLFQERLISQESSPIVGDNDSGEELHHHPRGIGPQCVVGCCQRAFPVRKTGLFLAEYEQSAYRRPLSEIQGDRMTGGHS